MHAGVDYFATRWLEADQCAAPGSPGAHREVRAVAAALTSLHGAGVAHCDLEPNHVLVSDGRLWILDFGSAALLAGSRDRRPIDRDLFCMGCYLAERLLGSPRFAYQTRQVLPQARRCAAQLRRSALGRVIERALASKIGGARPYRSADELERELCAALGRIQG